MTPLFLDPSVLLLGVGSPHPWREPCRAVIQAAADGRVHLHMSVEGGQEFLFHRLRRASSAEAIQESDALERFITWHSFDVEILRASRNLVSHGHARGRDAVHAATAVAAGFAAIVSCDADFDGIPGLERLDPAANPPQWGG